MKLRQAMIMAAGLGTRLRPFTEHRAKPFLPLMGVPLIQFSIDQARSLGVSEFAVNLHHRFVESQAHLQTLDWGAGARTQVSDESQLLLGSAGGLRAALSHLRDESFLWLNADVVLGFDLDRLVERHAEARRDHGVWMTLALHWDSQTHLVTHYSQDPIAQRPFFCGAAIVEPEALRHLPLGVPAEFVPEVLAPAVAQHRVAMATFRGGWWDIGSPELWVHSHLDLERLAESDSLTARIKSRLERCSPVLRPTIERGAVCYPGAPRLSQAGISFGSDSVIL